MPPQQPPHEEPLAAFHRAFGVTVTMHESPQNRFEEHTTSSPSSARPAGTAARQPLPSAPPPTPTPTSNGLALFEEGGEAITDAASAAAAATTLEALHAATKAFEACPLKATARQACVGEGPRGAPLMFIGEAPGRDEDEAGRPFVGRSGQLLNKMIAAIGFKREDVYISNVIPWRPPANRTPTPIETATCEPFIRREIALVAPKIVVPLGGPSAKLLLRSTDGIMRQRGRWVRYEDGDTVLDALPTFHPAYLLRTPGEKRRAWQDFLALRARLELNHDLPPL